MTEKSALTPREIASAFSGHRFAETYESLSDDVRWVAVGGATMIGRDAVIDICEATSRGLADTRTEFLRFLITSYTTLVPG